MIVSVPLAVFFALAALFSVVELIRNRAAPDIVSYVADREALATHVAMNGGMAAMFAPFYDAAIATGLQLGYLALGAALLLRLFMLRGRRPPGRAAGTVYHLVGLAAMVWAIRVMTASMPHAMAGMHDMAGMPGMAAPAPQQAWLALVLAALFLLDGLATATLAAFVPGAMVRMAQLTAGEVHDAAPPPRATLRLVRLAALPHVVMDAGMALMLWPLAFG